jgi:hypothetical protein
MTKDEVRAYHKAYSIKNRERISFLNNRWRMANPEACKAAQRRYRESHKRQILARGTAWRKKNIEHVRALGRKRRLKHLDKHMAWLRAWQARPENKAHSKAYRERKIQEDPNFALGIRLRATIRAAVKRSGAQKKSKYSKLESVKFLVWHAKKLGIPATTPDWHIDHLYPLGSLNLHDVAVQEFANSPRNIRWLTKDENFDKRNRQPTPEEVHNHNKLLEEYYASNHAKVSLFNELAEETVDNFV